MTYPTRLVLVGSLAAVTVCGCDESSTPPPPAPLEVETQSAPAAISQAQRVILAETHELDLPAGWDARAGPDGRSSELRGPSLANIPDDPLAQRAIVSIREPIRAPTLELTLAELRETDLQQENLEVLITRNDERCVVERRESNDTEVEFEGTRENRRFIKATYHVYLPLPDDTFETIEFNFLETTQSIHLRDLDTVRAIVHSLVRRETAP
jgi:hypothetical protein